MRRSCFIPTALFAWMALLLGPAASAENLQTLDDVRAMIERDDLPWTAGETSISARGWDRVRETLDFRVPASYDQIPKVDLSAGRAGKLDLPARWDWREHEGTTPVQDQGNCGSCWAFATIGAVEGCARIHDRAIYDLSEQQLLSCNLAGYGCDGGFWDGCLEVFQRQGSIAEECMPYQADDRVPCTAGACDPVAQVSDLIYIKPEIASIQAAVYEHGPIVCAMAVTEDFTYYTGGCYVNPHATAINHAVVIVGWDNDLCGGAWLCKNSWGTGWGELGYFTIKYGTAKIGDTPAVYVHTPGRVIHFEHEPLETTLDASRAFDVTTGIRTNGSIPLDSDSLRLVYRIDRGLWNEVPLTPAYDPGQWQAQIPRQAMPAAIEYYFRAADSLGCGGTAPQKAPDSLYCFDLARHWEKFEEDAAGWRVGDPEDRATSGVWECVVPLGTEAQPGADHSLRGSRCWLTGQHAEGEQTGWNDVDGGRTTLYSPAYDLSWTPRATVKYARWFSNDKGALGEEDPWIAQARNDGGAWVDMENTRQSSNAWVIVEIDLIDLLGPTLGEVEFRFIAADLEGGSCVEAAIDDFAILAESFEDCAVRSLCGEPIRVSTPSPNPVKEGAAITVTLGEERAGRIAIYGLDGRLVRAIRPEILRRGENAFVWDGKDDAGRTVPSGVYYMKVEAGVPTSTSKITVMR